MASRVDSASIDKLINEILADTDSYDEQLSAFQQAFSEHVPMPTDGFVIGEPVSIIAINYDGNERRGLTSRCRRQDGAEYTVATCDCVFSEGTNGSLYIAAYRKWMGLKPLLTATEPKRRPRATPDDLDFATELELVVLSVKQASAACRLIGSERILTLRTSRVYQLVPGEIATILPEKQWTYKGHLYLSGEITSTRLDVNALGLEPLALNPVGLWNPQTEYWRDEHAPMSDWEKSIMAYGSRPGYELEEVLPGDDQDDPLSDPIIAANEYKNSGDKASAEKLLMGLCQADLRCIDAHAHLGNLYFDEPKAAIRHYRVGVSIAELSLGDDFDGVLAWGWIYNRPFLRCMYGLGICLWRLGRIDEAKAVFTRMLWLNPADNQGIRFLINDVNKGIPWREDR